MTSIPPSIPFAVAKAYGTKPPAVTPNKPTPTDTPAKPKLYAPANPTIDQYESATTKLRAKVEGLIAAKVDKPAFDAVKPVSTGPDTIAFYRRPDDANTVATEIAVGRTLDTTG